MNLKLIKDMVRGWCPTCRLEALGGWDAFNKPHTCHGDLLTVQTAMLEAHDSCAEASDCRARPERFFDPCVHDEGIEPNSRGTRICRLARRAEIAALAEVK